MFTARTEPSCPNAAAVLDRALAVVLTDHDDEVSIAKMAGIITTEAAAWNP